jgi:hypothetical protein
MVVSVTAIIFRNSINQLNLFIVFKGEDYVSELAEATNGRIFHPPYI